MKTVYLMPNGVMAVFDEGGKQIGSLQKPYMQLIFDWLLQNGYDPTEFEYKMPDQRICHAIKVDEDQYNWH